MAEERVDRRLIFIVAVVVAVAVAGATYLLWQATTGPKSPEASTGGSPSYISSTTWIFNDCWENQTIQGPGVEATDTAFEVSADLSHSANSSCTATGVSLSNLTHWAMVLTILSSNAPVSVGASGAASLSVWLEFAPEPSVRGAIILDVATVS